MAVTVVSAAARAEAVAIGSNSSESEDGDGSPEHIIHCVVRSSLEEGTHSISSPEPPPLTLHSQTSLRTANSDNRLAPLLSR
jgi:hypothetical protein